MHVRADACRRREASVSTQLVEVTKARVGLVSDLAGAFTRRHSRGVRHGGACFRRKGRVGSGLITSDESERAVGLGSAGSSTVEGAQIVRDTSARARRNERPGPCNAVDVKVSCE